MAEGDGCAWSAQHRLRAALAVAAAAGLTLLVATGVPLRAQGGDTVPGRLAMATLACEQRSDLSSVAWVARKARTGRLPYYLRYTADRRGVVSTFGPGPGFLGRPFMAGVNPGARVDDRLLQGRARWGAATAVALSVALLASGLLAVTSLPWAVGSALAAGASFAGVATLGQGLWQQTACLPWLALALCSALWCRRMPGLLPLAVGASTLAVWLRPAELPLALGLAVLACLRAEHGGGRSAWRLGAALSACVLGSLPVMVWDLWYLDALWPRSQWEVNTEMAGAVLRVDPAHLAQGLWGLLASPARGWLWYAPCGALALLWPWWSFRRTRGTVEPWVLWGALAGQWLLAAAFHKWWGGLTFGPRLLALATWVAVAMPWLVRSPPTRGRQWVWASALVMTALVGVLGAALHDPRTWEIRRNPDRDVDALFDWSDSPWTSLGDSIEDGSLLRDAPPGPFVYCAPRGLREP